MHRVLALALLLACTGRDDAVDSVDTSPPTRCEQLGREAVSFTAGSGALNEPAGEALIPLNTGETWSFSSSWSGCDSWIFLRSQPRQINSGFGVDYWEGDHAELLANSPDNVHYFFVPNDGEDVAARLGLVQARMNGALVALTEAEILDWQERLHYVEATPLELGGWLGDALRDPGWGVVVGPDQTVRYMGSFADPERYDGNVGWFAPNLAKAANEARYGNFLVDRQAALDAETVDEIPLFTGERVEGSGFVDVTLPDAGTMAGYDTLAYDLTMECVGEGEFGDCPAWDYLVYLYQCDESVDDVDAFATTPCQEGETRPGACEDPMGGATEGTYTCKADGTGFEPLACPCDTETGRWITTYHREGRWVHDATPFLALLQDGGATRFRFWTSQPYELKLSFRLSNQGVGHRPTKLVELYEGAYYGPDVNQSYQPVDVDVPADAAHVELAAIVSGHGGGQLNCAEFCHTTNHFFVGGTEIVIEDDWVDVADGCEQQVDAGTVPNQYGTWWYGRNGWCPGKEVPVQRFDISAEATPGSTVRFDHETYGPNGIDLNGGNGERIEVESWMVVYE